MEYIIVGVYKIQNKVTRALCVPLNRSPDLTQLDFFLWGKFKDIVNKDIPITPDDMKQCITAACSEISAEMLERVQ